MEDTDKLGSCSRGLLPHGSVTAEASMSEDRNTGESREESPLNETPSSQSFITEISRAQSITSESTPQETEVSARRSRTKRGRSGKKWVSLNWEHKEQLKKDNSKCFHVMLAFMSYSFTDGEMPESDALKTSSFPHDNEWSEDNLPDILFYIKPPKSEYEGQAVGLLKENGEVVKVGKQQKPLRDFPILPRHISLEVPGWLIEAWRRIDPRITYPDILDRQTADHKLGLKKLEKNALQNHCRRECRMVLGMWTNYERREVPHRTDVEAIESLSYQNIMLNTILNVCPGRQDRLTKVRLTRRSQDGCGKYYAEPCEVNATNLYETTFPIDHFVLKSAVPTEGLHTMDSSMMAAWELSLILQERARVHNVSHWRKLADCCRPVSWFDRTINKRVENETFDSGCPVCTWVPGRDQIFHRAWIAEVKSACSKPAARKPSTIKDASFATTKRRKLEDGRSRKVSVDVAVELTEECECCKELGSSTESGPRSGQYPSEQFRRGEIKSYFRDADRVEETQIDDQLDDNEKRRAADEEDGHTVIKSKAKNSMQGENGDSDLTEDQELQLVSLILPI